MSSAFGGSPAPAHRGGASRADPQADHGDILARIWRQSLPLMRERIEQLEYAAECAGRQALAPELRTSAVDLAHKLAGSLGMFGYPRGTELARQMEQMLEAPGEPDGPLLARLTSELRASLRLED